MTRQRTFSGAPWEEKVGYCRAIRAGNQIYVTGTAPVEADGSVTAPGDARGQTRRCLEIIRGALADLGAEPKHVVRTRLYVTDIGRWAEYGDVHRAFFADHPPATTMVEVSALVARDMLIEIEVDAIAPAATS